MNKTRGQQAYEQSCAIVPFYPDGERRKAWEQLTPEGRSSWEADPDVTQEDINLMVSLCREVRKLKNDA